jgi:hypothetical protein
VIRRFEVSVTPDVLVARVERLGFTQVTTGEAFPYPYAAVADGRLAIGLHGHELAQSPLLSFVLPDLQSHIGAIERGGVEIIDRRLGEDVFNEASLEAAGQVIRLLEARTHSPSPQGPGETSLLGWFEEFVLPVADMKRAEAEWSGSASCRPRKAMSLPHIGLTSDSLNVALLPSGVLKRPR